MTAQLKCPQCKKDILWNDNFPHRPFCSQRCQLIDLGAWADEKFRIPEAANSNNTSPEAEWE